MEEHTECTASCHSLFFLVVCGLWRRALSPTAGDRRAPPEWNLEPRQAGRSYKTSLLLGLGLRWAQSGLLCSLRESGSSWFLRVPLRPRPGKSRSHPLCRSLDSFGFMLQPAPPGKCHLCSPASSLPLSPGPCPDPHLRDEDTPPLGLDSGPFCHCPDQPSPRLPPGLTEGSLFTSRTALGSGSSNPGPLQAEPHGEKSLHSHLGSAPLPVLGWTLPE